MNSKELAQWCQQFELREFQKPLIMGILNITPDSFSDGGRYSSVDKAFERALQMIHQGADIIDIGGESSRPEAQSVSASEEMRRVIPVIEQLSRESDIAISIDTSKASVMRAAVSAGACMINDIYALRQEYALETAAELKVPVCIMHMQGAPQYMQVNPVYAHPVALEINDFFTRRIEACVTAGLSPQQIILDPGIGFGKTVEHNLQILKHVQYFHHHQRPLLLGVSRKSMVGAILNKPISERVSGGLAVSVYAAMQGVRMLRTHDVSETIEAMRIIEAIANIA